MTSAELDRYRDKLVHLAHRLVGNVSGLTNEALRTTGGEASGNLSNIPMHLADLASDNFEQETSLGLLEMQGQTLDEVNAALDRIHQGTYGRCLDCGAEISAGRLDALPYTPHCIKCARKAQDDQPLVETPGNL